MSPPLRKVFSYEEAKRRGAKQSAVMILLYKKNNSIYLILTERTIYEGNHSGQISFPGGKKDSTDLSLEETAKRETFEEIGIDINQVDVLTELSHLYIPISNFIVYPFVGIYNGIPSFVKEDKEVHKILEVDIMDLLDSKNLSKKTIKLKNLNIQFKTPVYKVNNVEVWGATAMILSEFLEILKKS